MIFLDIDRRSRGHVSEEVAAEASQLGQTIPVRSKQKKVFRLHVHEPGHALFAWFPEPRFSLARLSF